MSVQAAAGLRDVASQLLPGTQAVIASIQDWWAGQALQAGLSGRWTDVFHALAAQPPAPIPPAEPLPEINESTTPAALGQLYVSSLANAERTKGGKHYTPVVLADRLWEMTRAALGLPGAQDLRLTGLIRDPACGAGALLLPPMREHLRASADVDPAITIRGLAARIHGIDEDCWSVWLTNVVLGSTALQTLSRIPEAHRAPIPVLAEAGDGLAAGREKALATIMNPPYGRLRLSVDARADYAHVLYGHANIYGMFMASGAANTRSDGVVACLVPTSFTAGRYFHRLRSYLTETTPLHSINFVEGRNAMFAGVLQETCLVVFRQNATDSVTVTRSNGHLESVAQVPVPKGEAPWLLPRESADASLAAAAARMSMNLGQAGWHASTGPLVWNRRRSDLYARPGKTRAVILWGADIDGGKVHRDKARDDMRFLSLTRKSDPAIMVLREPAVLVQRTTSPEQHRRLTAAELDQDTLDKFGGRVVIENHVNILRPTHASPLLTRASLARILQTRTMDRVIRCISGSIAVSSYEIDNLPLPSAAVLASWECLEGEILEQAVAAAYVPGANE